MTNPIPTYPLQIWVISFDDLRAHWQQVSSCLSEDELARANRFRFNTHRIDFIVSRALLRRTLARQLHCEPGAVQFSYGKHGKPALTESLHFNLSHCQTHVALAVGSSGPLGIDVECADRKTNPTELAKTCFSSVEQSQLVTFDSPALVRQAFFRGWTRKEAFIKALGYGLQAPLREFDIDLSVTSENALIESRVAGHKASQWQIRDLALGEAETCAAICVGATYDWTDTALQRTE